MIYLFLRVKDSKHTFYNSVKESKQAGAELFHALYKLRYVEIPAGQFDFPLAVLNLHVSLTSCEKYGPLSDVICDAYMRQI